MWSLVHIVSNKRDLNICSKGKEILHLEVQPVPPCLVCPAVPLSPVDLWDLQVQVLLFLHEVPEDLVDLKEAPGYYKCSQICPHMPRHLWQQLKNNFCFFSTSCVFTRLNYSFWYVSDCVWMAVRLNQTWKRSLCHLCTMFLIRSCFGFFF